jgi:putative sigma-54 modulation protein
MAYGRQLKRKRRPFVEIRLFDGNIKTSKAQLDYVKTKVGAAAERLKDAACTIDVRLTDINGPKGGLDKQCSIVVTPPGLGTLRVENQAADYYTAIDAAAAALKKSLARSLERTKANGPR